MKNIVNPISTYRIQFNNEFTFSDFEKILPYLQQLGIKTIYASPIFEATPGSSHGYDGTDPNKVNPEIGTQEQLTRISNELKKHNMYWLQDIVPNHLSFHENNAMLMDVLEKGQKSPFSEVFDINWSHPDYPGKVMVPFPGSSLETILKQKFPGEAYYALCSWQETDYRMNYRRFFLVNTLICTNVHKEEVFTLYHQLIKKLVDDGVFDGLRIDHVDGLYDPTKYLNDLRNLAGDKSYIIVEKILENGEEMPEYWPIQGNSGYDFLGMVNNLLTNSSSASHLTRFYADIVNDDTPVEKQIHDKKRMILNNYMGGELDNLARLYREVSGIAEDDVSSDQLKGNIADYLVACPIYRYYENIPMMDMDKDADKNRMKPFYQRCMQFTGPLMAKGVEDTLMYTYNRFIGHNEVGDSPEYFGYSADQFHVMMQTRRDKWPLAMNASSTHDTKRGEDVRARLNALTDFHQEWTELVAKWQRENESLRKNNAPDRNDEYFIYQTLVGSYPIISPSGVDPEEIKHYPQRLKDYLEKSLREAKIHSSWTEPESTYEEATIAFAHSLLQEDSLFHKSFLPFVKKIIDHGMINSFVQLILKTTCPGIPDIYQGTELWDLSLVDPDNRRPVDFEKRASMLQQKSALHELWNTRWTGQVKLVLLHQLLKIRNEHNELLTSGEYVPVNIKGRFSSNVFAFRRILNGQKILVAVPLNYGTITKHSTSGDLLKADWKDTQLELENDETEWMDLLRDSKVQLNGNVGDLFRNFPMAILLK